MSKEPLRYSDDIFCVVRSEASMRRVLIDGVRRRSDWKEMGSGILSRWWKIERDMLDTKR